MRCRGPGVVLQVSVDQLTHAAGERHGHVLHFHGTVQTNLLVQPGHGFVHGRWLPRHGGFEQRHVEIENSLHLCCCQALPRPLDGQAKLIEQGAGVS